VHNAIQQQEVHDGRETTGMTANWSPAAHALSAWPCRPASSHLKREVAMLPAISRQPSGLEFGPTLGRLLLCCGCQSLDNRRRCSRQQDLQSHHCASLHTGAFMLSICVLDNVRTGSEIICITSAEVAGAMDVGICSRSAQHSTLRGNVCPCARAIDTVRTPQRGCWCRSPAFAARRGAPLRVTKISMSDCTA